MKRFKLVSLVAAFAAVISFVSCSNSSGGGDSTGGSSGTGSDAQIAAAKAAYSALLGEWTMTDSKGKVNVLTLTTDKVTGTFDDNGELWKYYDEISTGEKTEPLSQDRGKPRSKVTKGISTIGLLRAAAESAHAANKAEFATVMSGEGKNFNDNDLCLYCKIVTDANAGNAGYEVFYFIALRQAGNGQLEALLSDSPKRDSSGVHYASGVPVAKSFTFTKKSSSSGGGGSGSIDFALEGSWKMSGETLSGRYIKIFSGGSFDMYKNGSASSLYSDRKWSKSGSQITLSFKMSNGITANGLEVEDTFEVTGSASSMKWTLVKSRATDNGSSYDDTSTSQLLQSFWGMNAKEIQLINMN
ncbi:MAG: hypothetical protein IK015_04700 [Treponema sp.]|nr:hypothetical protein [Treponema sp.]